MVIPVWPGTLVFHYELTHVEGRINLVIISPEELIKLHLAN